MSTKKLLVAYDESMPTAGQGDFLAVVFEGTGPMLFGLRSRRIFKTGRVVFLGKEINENEVFVKLVDSGRKIESVDQALANIAAYIQQLASFKIGNVVGLVAKDGNPGFELIKIADTPRLSEAKKLP